MTSPLDTLIKEIKGKLEKATSGEWELETQPNDDSEGTTTYVVNGLGDRICETEWRWVGELEEAANADLIASSPGYLRKLLAVVKLQREALEEVRAQASVADGINATVNLAWLRSVTGEALAKADELAGEEEGGNV